jgi:pimeloyl-ACP methyl ester carboxylesterase
VADVDLRTNPDAQPNAPSPSIRRIAANGTTLYSEVRGSGPAVMLIHAGGEDAEEWRPIAERLSGFTALSYDRRGTLRSGRNDWPGQGSAQHADDAAALLIALGLRDVLVFGGSAGGIVALQLALRYPGLIRCCLAFEPGYFRLVPGGEAFSQRPNEAMEADLAYHPDDWAGAYAAFGRAVSPSPTSAPRGFFTQAGAAAWYTEREDGNAEALVRDDIPILTRELVDHAELASSAVDIRFSFGANSLSIFRDIATRLAAIRSDTADAIEGVGHSIYYHPDTAVAYIRSQSQRSTRA